MNGDWTEEQVFVDYLKTFDSPNDPDGKASQATLISKYMEARGGGGGGLQKLPPPLQIGPFKLLYNCKENMVT